MFYSMTGNGNAAIAKSRLALCHLILPRTCWKTKLIISLAAPGALPPRLQPRPLTPPPKNS